MSLQTSPDILKDLLVFGTVRVRKESLAWHVVRCEFTCFTCNYEYYIDFSFSYLVVK